MNGMRDLALGGLFFVGGIVVTVISLTGGQGGVIAYGAIAVGAFMLIKGGMQQAEYRKAVRAAKARAEAGQPAEVGAGTITRAQADEMIDLVVGVAAADGQLAPGERVILRSVARDVFAADLSDADVQAIYDRVSASAHGFEAGLYRLQGKIPPQMGPTLLRYAAMVAYADGELGAAEQAALAKMTEILSVSDTRKQVELQAAFQQIQRIMMEQQQAREAAAGPMPG